MKPRRWSATWANGTSSPPRLARERSLSSATVWGCPLEARPTGAHPPAAPPPTGSAPLCGLCLRADAVAATDQEPGRHSDGEEGQSTEADPDVARRVGAA